MISYYFLRPANPRSALTALRLTSLLETSKEASVVSDGKRERTPFRSFFQKPPVGAIAEYCSLGRTTLPLSLETVRSVVRKHSKSTAAYPSPEPYADCYQQRSSRHLNEVKVIDKGRAVSIFFRPSGDREILNDDVGSSSIFHAPWLWSNDPTSILLPSGQRTRFPGNYPGCRIWSASVVTASSAAVEIKKHEADGEEGPVAVLPVPPPPAGCSHPIGAVFQTGDIHGVDSNTTSKNDQMLLRLVWDDDSSTSHRSSSVSYYDMEWLRTWRYDERALRERVGRTEVTTSHALRRRTSDNDDAIVRLDYKGIASNAKKDRLLELLHALFRDGAAVVQNAPLIGSGPFAPVSVVGRVLAGSLSHGSLYGDVFHVRNIPDAHNIAYTNEALAPHHDLAYYESMPGMQLLHCISNGRDVEGGESVLIDCMAAAHEFRRIAPEHFRTLVTCPATFVKQRNGACMTCLRPHISLREGPDMNDMGREIVAVHWSPPFEGPLCAPPDQVEAYYAAYAAFQLMLDNSICPADQSMSKFSNFAKEHTWERRLEPGEMLIFSNRRMLHGRRGFRVNSAASSSQVNNEGRCPDERHLVGAYTNIDDTLNRYRVILQERDEAKDTLVLNAGNGTSIVP